MRRRTLRVPPGSAKLGLLFPHSQRLETTSTASAGLSGHLEHQRACFVPGTPKDGNAARSHSQRRPPSACTAPAGRHCAHQRAACRGSPFMAKEARHLWHWHLRFQLSCANTGGAASGWEGPS